MLRYKVKIELPKGGYGPYIEFDEIDDEYAHGRCYDLADRDYYKLYRKVNNNGITGYHWTRIE